MVLLLDALESLVCHRTARGNWYEKVGLEAVASSRDAGILFIGGIM